MPTITLPDGISGFSTTRSAFRDVAAAIGPGLAKSALAGKVDGRLVDISHVLNQDANLAIITERDPEGLEIIRHSSAHLLAHAVKQLYPTAQVTIGPVIENGFYYDFAFERTFTPDDLERIQARMEELAAQDIPVERSVMPRDEAVAFFRQMGEEYKAQIIADIPSDQRFRSTGRVISSISVAARTFPQPVSSKHSS
jgi:threonyl-tRNA synthetase